MPPQPLARAVAAALRLGPLLAAAVVGAGCGPRTHPVAVSFTLPDGRPLTAGAVVVQHATDPVVLGGGPIEADGTCRPLLRGTSAPGLPAGTYRLGVTGQVSADLDEPSPSLPFDPVFTNPAASGLTLTVGPGSPEQATFSLAKPR
jgi:hypothetical protein